METEDLFKIKYSEGLIKAESSGQLDKDISSIESFDGVNTVDISNINYSSGHIYTLITYNSDSVSLEEISEQIKQREKFENVIVD